MNAPSVFQITEPAGWPGFTTKVLPVPADCPAVSSSVRSTNCSYELAGQICSGAQPDLLACNTTTDCTNADSGTCYDEHAYCSIGPPTWCKPPLTPPQIAQCNRSGTVQNSKGICVANSVWWCAGYTPGPTAVRVSLRANFATSGPGDVRAGILVQGRPVAGPSGELYSIDTADPYASRHSPRLLLLRTVDSQR